MNFKGLTLTLLVCGAHFHRQPGHHHHPVVACHDRATQ